jgi:folate-binding protein YgfZ
MLKHLLLRPFHESNGAVWSERDGWLLPGHFGNSMAEYQVVRGGVGLMDRSDHVFTSFAGPDRLSYFQGMISNDLRPLSPGRGLYATVLNVFGKVLGDCRVFCTDEAYLVEWWEPIKVKMIDHLNRYLVADEVEIQDLTSRYGILSIQGPKAAALLQALISRVELPVEPFSHSLVTVNGIELRVVKESHTGENGFDLVIPQSSLRSVAQRLTETGKLFSAGWIGGDAQETLRIEAGIPRYGVDVTEDHLLLETGLNHAVSFTKGCYLGQEIVERVRSRGHINRKLCGLLISGNAQRGDLVYADTKEIGTITSTVHSPALNQYIALGYLHRDYWSPGTEVSIHRNRSSIASTVVALPFVPHNP